MQARLPVWSTKGSRPRRFRGAGLVATRSAATAIAIKNFVRTETGSGRRRNIRVDLRGSGSNGIERRIVVGALAKGESVTVITDKWAAPSKCEVSGAPCDERFFSSLAGLSASGEMATL